MGHAVNRLWDVCRSTRPGSLHSGDSAVGRTAAIEVLVRDTRHGQRAVSVQRTAVGRTGATDVLVLNTRHGQRAVSVPQRIVVERAPCTTVVSPETDGVPTRTPVRESASSNQQRNRKYHHRRSRRRRQDHLNHNHRHHHHHHHPVQTRAARLQLLESTIKHLT